MYGLAHPRTPGHLSSPSCCMGSRVGGGSRRAELGEKELLGQAQDSGSRRRRFLAMAFCLPSPPGVWRLFCPRAEPQPHLTLNCVSGSPAAPGRLVGRSVCICPAGLKWWVPGGCDWMEDWPGIEDSVMVCAVVTHSEPPQWVGQCTGPG
jgi:hypothetical protein